MSVARTSSTAHQYDELSRVADRARVQSRMQSRQRIRYAIALLAYSASYPLLGVALWRGARNGEWTFASILVALGVIASFIGWGLLSAIGEPRKRSAKIISEYRPVDVTVYVALYNRVGAVVVLLESYTVAATSLGWPMPQSFTGWFALVWIPLFTAFVVPIARTSTSTRDDPGE